MRRHDLGEADRILTLYTRDYGKQRTVAKGIRKPQSRKAGHLELFALVDVLISSGRTLDVITQADMTEAFLPLRTDLERTTYAMHFIELIDAFTEDEDENTALFGLLVSGLGWVAATTKLALTASYFEIRLLNTVGYQPEVFNCVVCGEEIKARAQYFSSSDGGVVCPSCGEKLPRVRRLSLNALKVLRHMQRYTYEVVTELDLQKAVQKEVRGHLHATLTYHLERRLRSAAFLDRLLRETPPDPS